MKDVSPGASSDLRSILLFTACAAFLVFFWASPAPAQNGDGDDDDGAANEQYSASQNQYSGSESSEGACPNPNVVATIEAGETENRVVPFQTTGRTFRVNYSVDFRDDDPTFKIVEIDIEDDFGLVDFENVREDQEGSFIVTEGAGSYELVTSVAPDDGATYSVTVEDCVGGTAETTTQTTDDPQSGVIPETFPNKPLADTGMGMAVSGSAGPAISGAMVLAALIGAAAVSGGFGAAMIRIGKRR